jgi:prepilin-type N-terminal cleavage/methylation domain-containing protein/prepilin-type processing-associated H-X9-DG protein
MMGKRSRKEPCMQMGDRRFGFTLLELLVVMAIIGVLVGLLVVAVVRIREAASRAACVNNIKQIALAVHTYHDANQYVPYSSMEGPYGPYGPSTLAWSWLARLLPYLDEGNLYEKANLEVNTLYESRDVAAQRIPVFLCQSDPTFGQGPRSDAADLGEWNPPNINAGNTTYKGVMGSNWLWGDLRWRNPGANGQNDPFIQGDGMFYRDDYNNKKQLAAITDGLSNTFMVGEAVPDYSKWCSWPYANNAIGTCAIAPNAKNADGSDFDPWDWSNTYAFASRHPGGLHFGMADGSVHFVNDNIAIATYRALATIRGNESVELPQ